MFEESQQSLQKLKGENQEFGEVVEHLNEEIKKGKESLAEKECVLMEADKQLSEFEVVDFKFLFYGFPNTIKRRSTKKRF